MSGRETLVYCYNEKWQGVALTTPAVAHSFTQGQEQTL